MRVSICCVTRVLMNAVRMFEMTQKYMKNKHEDLEFVESMINVDPMEAVPIHLQHAQVYALFSIAKTLRRLEEMLNDRITVGVEQI